MRQKTLPGGLSLKWSYAGVTLMGVGAALLLNVGAWTLYAGRALEDPMPAAPAADGEPEGVSANLDDLALIQALHASTVEHVDQSELMRLVQAGEGYAAYGMAFELGDELFEVRFTTVDGVGASVGPGQRFSSLPRADLTGDTEWASHLPIRATGPNAEACVDCHNAPFDDGAGGTSSNVLRDPEHTGQLGSFIVRNTPHIFAPGAVQRLAEEMTDDLHRIRDEAIATACRSGSARAELTTQGVSFGTLRVTRTRTTPCETKVDTGQVHGVAADLVVRPFQWKGTVATLRDFVRDATHNELGLQAVEYVGEGADADGDLVADELTIGDVTALTIYQVAQPRPTTLLELAEHGLIDPLPAAQETAINRGSALFEQIGCASCHVPALTLRDPIFSEPSQNPHFRDTVFPAGQDPVAAGVDPASPITFDLTRDQPDNLFVTADGTLLRLGSLRVNAEGQALVELYGDLRRHDMGPALAEPIDEKGTGASVFLTENLWGVGSTAPYLHDGRASTLAEAILLHGGEADAARAMFRALSLPEQKAIIAFLENLVLFKDEVGLLPWEVGVYYRPGDAVVVDGQIYQCVRGHLARATLEPAAAAAYWKLVSNQ